MTGPRIARAPRAVGVVVAFLLVASSGVAVLPLPDRSLGPWEQTDRLLPQDMGEQANAFEYLGESMDADGDRVAVGATGTDTIYIFEHREDGWTQTAKLADDFDAGVGESVALEGDLLAFGAPWAGPRSVHHNGHGAAYIFEKVDGAWIESAHLMKDDPQVNDEFGREIEIVGETVFVGVPFEGAKDGAVYVYEKQGQNWELVQRLEGDPHESFGFSLADNGEELAVGSAWDPTVRLYEDSGESWVRTQSLEAVEEDEYAFDLAMDEDTLAVGSAFTDRVHGKDVPQISATGSVPIYEKSAGTWSYEETLYQPVPNPLGLFGYSVDVVGDRIVVGAPDSHPQYSGAAYPFERGPDGWDATARLSANDTGPGDVFGETVAATGDQVIVAAAQDDERRDGSPSPLGDQGDIPPCLGLTWRCDRGEDSGVVYAFSPSGTEEVSPGLAAR